MAGKEKKTKKVKPPRQARASRPSALSRWWAGVDGQVKARAGRAAAWGVFGVLGAAGLVAGLCLMERYVEGSQARCTSGQYEIRLADVPSWVPVSLRAEIAESFRPAGVEFGSHGLAEKVYALAAKCPWAASGVRVRRVRQIGEEGGGYVQVAMEFLKPVARVPFRSGYVYVDQRGVVLPSSQVPQLVMMDYRRQGDELVLSQAQRQVCFMDESEVPKHVVAAPIHYVNIELGLDRKGTALPPEPGEQWRSEDLAEALRLADLVSGRPYGNQITTIDARNFKGRVNRHESQLEMYAQIDQGPPTRIPFGRFPTGDGDYVVSPEQKMAYLDEYATRNGGIMAGIDSVLDLRYDQLRVCSY